ncbi:MAG: substrate-binding domain-containing protein [Chloroflexota bacterium]
MNQRGLKALLASMAVSLIVTACAPAATPSAPSGKAEAPKTEAPAVKSEAPAAKAEAAKPAAPAQPAASTGAGWEAEWQRVVEAAKKEKVVVVTHPGSDYQNLIASFKKEFPDIEVEHTGARPSDISPKIITEQQNGVFNWDIMVATTSNMNNVLLPANAYQDIQPFFVRRDVMEDAHWGGGKFEMYTSNDQKSIIVHNAALASQIYINREKIGKDKLSTIDDLMKPEFQGQIVVDDCTVPAHGMSALVGMWQTKGEDFVRTVLSQQKPVFQDTVRITTEWVATGRYPIGIGVDSPELRKLQSNGIGTQVEIMSIGGNLSTQGSAVFRNAPHPNASKVFLNWLWSKDGQTAFVDAFKESTTPNSRRLDAPVIDRELFPDYKNFDSYISWTMDSGRPLIQKIAALCKELRS